MFIHYDTLKEEDPGDGTHRIRVDPGKHLNLLKSRLSAGQLVESHAHSEEQFGYVISGTVEATIGNETEVINPGDSYFAPANVTHSFRAISDAVTIDVFGPVRNFSTI